MPDYHAGCHCDAVRITVRRPQPIDSLIDCNCSICVKKGILHLAVEEADLRIDHGEENLALYQWQSNTASHWFCKICGIHVLTRPRSHPERYSVNARCLDDFEEILPSLTLIPFDGKNHPKDRSPA
ncbi:MAG TPA: GFA family protein [Alphaproteobacteria bacterium]|nr:GFA family protein [Alphaproteobacteria bacterium]